MRIEIFKSGRQTDSSGNIREWSDADLDTIASTYNPTNHEAPVCIGHPKDNAPAWGWVKSVTREGSSLFAEIGDLVDEFSEMLSKKMFKKRSISLYPDLSLRHIGFLGAQPPAVKGLADFKFSESASVEFMDWDEAYSFKTVGGMFQRLRDWMLSGKDPESADKILPQYEIDNLKTVKVDDTGFGYTENSTEDEDMDKVAQLEAQVAEFSQKFADATATITTITARAEAAESKVKTLEVEKVTGELASFAEKMVAAGKLLPANKEAAISFMSSISANSEIDFAEGDKTVKKTPLKIYQEAIESGPQLVHFGEIATGGVAESESTNDTGPASKKLSELTEEKMNADKSLKYQDASRMVFEENPDLAQSYALEMA